MQIARHGRANTDPKDFMVYPVAPASPPVKAPLLDAPRKASALPWRLGCWPRLIALSVVILVLAVVTRSFTGSSPSRLYM